jgi:nucleoside-diphosphate-sugar epimerase
MGEVFFVTGATGQIGGPLVRRLLAGGHEVRALVRDPGRASGLDGAELVAGAMEDGDAVEKGIAGARHVIHLAGGLRGPGEVDAERLNLAGTNAVLEVARRHRKELGSFVYGSTCAVYGDRSGLWVTEDHAPAPHTKYGKAKVAAEALVLRAAREEKFPGRVARIAAVFGPGLRFMQAERIQAGRAWLPGEGKNHVPVVHIGDCVAALEAIALRGQNAGIYNVADRGTPTLREFYAEVTARVGGSPVRFWSTWVPSALQHRLAETNERVVSRLGRKPRFTTDNLRLFTASVRLKTERIEKELEFAWRYGDWKEAVAASAG